MSDIDPEALAEAMWDAREIKDPSGERTGCTSDDPHRASVFWKQTLSEGLWPGSVDDQRREAKLVLELLAAPSSTSDTPAAPEVTDDMVERFGLAVLGEQWGFEGELWRMDFRKGLTAALMRNEP